MSRVKIQYLVSEDVSEILNLLSKNDRARFIEVAIRHAYNTKKIKEYFSWSSDSKKTSSNTNDVVENLQVKKPKIKIDNSW